MDNSDAASRVVAACEACRKRKRKCDGEKPSCSWCSSKEIQCQYILERPKKRKHDPDYIASLEDQVKLLKEEIGRLHNQSAASYDDEPISKYDVASAEKGSTYPDKEPSQESSVAEASHFKSSTAIDDISSLMWRMTVKDNGETSFYGPSGNFCFPELQHAVTAESQKESCNEAPTSRRWIPHDPSIAMTLVKLFTENINPVHQFVESATLSRLRQDSSPSMELLEYAILAAGALFSDDTSLRAYGDKMAAQAESICLSVCRSNASIEAVQALVILSWRDLSQENDNMGFMFNSMAASLSLHLGLHVASFENLNQTQTGSYTQPMDPNLNNRRIKAAWALLFSDRVATSLLGRNCMIPWRRVRVPTFLEAVGDNASQEEIVFDAHSQLWFTHDQYMDQIYSFEFKGLEDGQRHQLLLEARERLLSLHRQLSPRIQLHKENNSPVVLLFYISYNMSRILIHRPYLQEPRNSTLHRLSIQTMSIAAGEIARLVRQYQKGHPLDKAPPHMVHSVMTAAVSLLLNTTSTNTDVRNRSIRQFRTCLDSLEAMQVRWPRAKKAIIALRELAERWNVVIALPLRYSFPLQPNRESECPNSNADTQRSESPDLEADDISLGDWNWQPEDSLDLIDSALFDEVAASHLNDILPMMR